MSCKLEKIDIEDLWKIEFFGRRTKERIFVLIIDNKANPTDSNPPAFSRASTVQSGTKSELFVTLQKGQEKVKVKTTGLVHNFIIPVNC